MTKYVGAKQRSERTQLQRAVLAMLATGMMAWPSFSPVYASDFNGHDGHIVNNGNVDDVYTAVRINNAVGANKFTYFNISEGKIANMHFTRWNEGAKGDNFHTLLNFVDNRININGTVNAIRNGKIGGNLYFISPEGMVVGASGAINTGALTVVTPTKAYYGLVNTLSAVGGTPKFLVDMFNDDVPLNSSGSIVINGKIRTAVEARFMAPKIYVGTKDVDSYGVINGHDKNHAAKIMTGVDFSSIVNTSELTAAYADTDLGTLELKTETKADGTEVYYVLDEANKMRSDGAVRLEASDKIAHNRLLENITEPLNPKQFYADMSTEIEISKDSVIESVGDVNIAAVTDASPKGLKLPTNFSFIKATADVKVDGIIKAGLDANITATATGSASDIGTIKFGGLTKDDLLKGNGELVKTLFAEGLVAGIDPNLYAAKGMEKLQEILPSFLKNNRATLTMVQSKANVTVGATAEVSAKNDVNVESTASAKALAMNTVKPDNKTYEAGDYPMENIVLAFVSGGADSVVNVQGKLTAEEGTVTAMATGVDSITAMPMVVANLHPLSGAYSGYANIDLAVALGKNNAHITIGENAVLEGGLGVVVGSSTSSEGSVTASLGTDHRAALNTGVGYLSLDAHSTTDILGNITSNGFVSITGGADVDSVSNSVDNSSSFASMVPDAETIMINGEEHNVDEFPELDIGDEGVKRDENGQFINAYLNLLFEGNEAKMSNNMPDGSKPIEAFKLGMAISISDVGNNSLINVGDKAVIKALGTDVKTAEKSITNALKINSLSDINGTSFSASSDMSDACTSEHTTQVDTDAAVVVSNITNDANIVFAARTAADPTVIYVPKGTADITARAETGEPAPVTLFNTYKELFLGFPKAAMDALRMIGSPFEKYVAVFMKYNEVFGITPDGKAPVDTDADGSLYAQDVLEKLQKVNNETKDASGKGGLERLAEDLINMEKNGNNITGKLYEFSLKEFSDNDVASNSNYTDSQDGNIVDLTYTPPKKYSGSALLQTLLEFKNLVTVTLMDPINSCANVTATAQAGASTEHTITNLSLAGAVAVTNEYNHANVVIGKNNRLDAGRIHIDAQEEAFNVSLMSGKRTIDIAGGKLNLTLPWAYQTTGQVGIGGNASISKIESDAVVLVSEGVELNTVSNGKSDADLVTYSAKYFDKYQKDIDTKAEISKDDGAYLMDYAANTAGNVKGTLSGDVNITGGVKDFNISAILGAGKTQNFGLSGMVAVLNGHGSTLIGVDDEAIIRAARNVNIHGTNNVALASAVLELSKTGGTAFGASVGVLNYDVDNLVIVGDNDIQEVTSTTADDKTTYTITLDPNSRSGLEATDFTTKLNKALGEYYRYAGLTETSLETGMFIADNLTVDAKTSGFRLNITAAGVNSGASDFKNYVEGNNADIGAAGSVSTNTFTTNTIAALETPELTMKKEEEGKGHLVVYAEDSGFVGAISGAAAFNFHKTENENFDAKLAGAVALNNITRTTATEIYRTKITNGVEAENHALNNGTQVAAGLSAGLTVRDFSSGVNISASVSKNTVTNNTRATMKNVTANDFMDAAVVNNIADARDIQVAGGINFDLARGNFACIGATVTLNTITNNTDAIIDGGSFDVKELYDYANTKFNQVSGGISAGFQFGNAEGTVLSGQGVGATNTINNITHAYLQNGATVTAQKADVAAMDGKLTLSTKTNSYALFLQERNFDINGTFALEMANSSGANLDLEVKENGNNDNDVELPPEIKYTTKEFTNDGKDGNTMVAFAAVAPITLIKEQFVELMGAVVTNSFTNTYEAKIDSSTLTIKSSAAEALKVRSKSDGNLVAAAAGVKIGSGGALSSDGTVVKNTVKDTVNALINNSIIKSDSTKIYAHDKTQAVGVAGAVGISKAAGSIVSGGLTWAESKLENLTSAKMVDTSLDRYSDTGKADLAVQADNNFSLYSIAAEIAADLQFATPSILVGNGAYAYNYGTNNTEAVIEGTAADKSKINNGGNITVSTDDTSKELAVAVAVKVKSALLAGGVHIAKSYIGEENVTTPATEADNKHQRNKAAINKTTITLAGADSALTVKAVDDSNLTTIAVGGGFSTDGSVATFANLNGSVAKAKNYKDVEAAVNDTAISVAGDLVGKKMEVLADNTMKMTTSADGASIGKDNVVMGAAGVATSDSVMTTKASVKGLSTATDALKIGSMEVQAKSFNQLTNVGVALCGELSTGIMGTNFSIDALANVACNDLKNDTIALVDDFDVNADSVKVEAKSEEKITNVVGAANIEVAFGGGNSIGIGLGAAVAVNNIHGDTIAEVKSSNLKVKDNFTVLADALHRNKNVVFSGGLPVQQGAVAVDAGGNAVVSDNEISGNTKALVTNSKVNEGVTDSNAVVDVKAKDNIVLDSTTADAQVALSITFTAGVNFSVLLGAGVLCEDLSRNTEAQVLGTDGNHSVINAKTFNVNAISEEDVDVANACVGASLAVDPAALIALAAGNISPQGALAVSVASTHVDNKGITLANVNYVDSDNQGMLVNAEHKEDVYGLGVAASGTFGIFGGSVGVDVYKTTNDAKTFSLLQNSAITHINAGLFGDKVSATNNLILTNKEIGVDAAIALGLAGGVAIWNNDFKSVAKAEVLNTSIGTASNHARDVEVLANTKVDKKFKSVEVGVGVIAVGANRIRNTINTTTNADITATAAGANNVVYADCITINANEDRKVTDNILEVTLGVLTVAVSDIVTNIGFEGTGTYTIKYSDKVVEDTINDDDESLAETKIITVNDNDLTAAKTKDTQNKTALNTNFSDKLNDLNGKVDSIAVTTPVTYTGNVLNIGGLTQGTAPTTTVTAGVHSGAKNMTLEAAMGMNITTDVVNNISSTSKSYPGVIGVYIDVIKNFVNLHQNNTVDITSANLRAGGTLKIGNTVSGSVMTHSEDAKFMNALAVTVIESSAKRDGKTELNVTDSKLLCENDNGYGYITLNNLDTTTFNAYVYGGGADVLCGGYLEAETKDTSKMNMSITGTTVGDTVIFGKNIAIENVLAPKLDSSIVYGGMDLVNGQGTLATAWLGNEDVTLTDKINYLNIDKADIFGDSVEIINGLSDNDGHKANLTAFEKVTSVGVLDIAVNKGRTTSIVNVGTDITNIRSSAELANAFRTSQNLTQSFGVADWTITSYDSINIANTMENAEVGIGLCTGTNYIRNIVNNKNILNLTTAENTTLEAKKLTILTESAENGTMTVEANDGGVIGISPVAAGVKNETTYNTSLTIGGKYAVLGNADIQSKHKSDLTLKADGHCGSVVGGSGIMVKSNATLNNALNVTNAEITTLGTLTLESLAQVDVNKNYNKDGDKPDDFMLYASNKGGLANGVGSKLNNTVTIHNSTNVTDSKLHSFDNMLVKSHGEHHIFATQSGVSSGIAVGATESRVHNTVDEDNKVVISGNTELYTLDKNAELFVVATDKTSASAKGFSERTFSVAAGAASYVYDTVTRDNIITINNGGKLRSFKNVNLFANLDEKNVLGQMLIQESSRTFTSGAIVVPYSDIVSNLTQNSQVYVKSGASVESIGDVNIYADAGLETIDRKLGSYCWYKNNLSEEFMSTSKGNLANGQIARDNWVKADGTITAGILNNLNITIGGTGTPVIVVPDAVTKTQFSGNPQGYIVYTPDQYASFISITSTPDLSAEDLKALTGISKEALQPTLITIGDTNDPVLDNILKLLGEYAADGENSSTYKALLAAKELRIKEMSRGSGTSSTDPDIHRLSENMCVEIPNIVAGGGNVNIETDKLDGAGTITAKGMQSVEIINNSSMTLKINDITITNPGGQVNYNGTTLPQTGYIGIVEGINYENVRDVGEVRFTVNSSATSATPIINIEGKWSGDGVNFAARSYKLQNEAGDWVKWDDIQKKYIVCYESEAATETIAAGTAIFPADIYVLGSLQNLSGDVKIKSSNNNIVVTGSDGAGIRGSKILLQAEHGSVTQLKPGETVNIGNSPELYYGEIFNNFTNSAGKFDSNPSDTSGECTWATAYAMGFMSADLAQWYSTLSNEAKADLENGQVTIDGTKYPLAKMLKINSEIVDTLQKDFKPLYDYLKGTSDGEFLRFCMHHEYQWRASASATPTSRTVDMQAIVRKDGDIAKPGDGSIAGANVYILADNINVNGIVQSGYGKYQLALTAADEARIQEIKAAHTANNQGNTTSGNLTDAEVLNNPKYCIREGGAVWDSATNSFRYEMAAYYNPDDDTVVTPGVNSQGGQINLIGRIVSTGDGSIKCLDGVSTINVENTYNHNLAINDLVVNDVQGKVTIVDTGLERAVEITRDGVNALDFDGATSTLEHITGSNGHYTYQPKQNLRYEWVSGDNYSIVKTYQSTMRATWWGWADYEKYGVDDLLSQDVETHLIGTTPGTLIPRLAGDFIVEESSGQSNFMEIKRVKNPEVTGQKEFQGAPEAYTTGFYGCHKWLKFKWTERTGYSYTNYAQMRADLPFSIDFIGVKAEDGYVNISNIGAAGQDKTVKLYGNIGNTKLYEIKDPANETTITGRVEKGSVNIKSNGSIDYIGGNIYAKDVDLSAKGNINNVQIKAGDIVNLDAWTTLADGKVNVSVSKNGLANGAVQVGAFGGADNKNASVALASLTSQGDILRANTAKYNNGIAIVQGDRIDLISTEGQIGAADNFLFVNGGQIADTSNSMSASVNAEAKNNIYLHQTQGNLRVGRIIVNDLNTGDNGHGNLYIEVPEGSIQDAQTVVVDSEEGTKKDLLDEWASLGLIDDGSEVAKKQIAMKNEMLQAERKALIRERDNVRKQEVIAELQERENEYNTKLQEHYQQIAAYQAFIDDPNTNPTDKSAAETTLENLNTSWSTYETAYNAKKTELETLRDSAALNVTEARKEEINNLLATMPETYQVWNGEQMLYAMQSRIINPSAGVETSRKDPNLYAQNINLKVRDNVGILNANEKVISTVDLYKKDGSGKFIHIDDIRAISWADPGTAVYNSDAQTITLKEQIVIGLQEHSGVSNPGKLTVTGYAMNDNYLTGDVNLETRRFQDLAKSNTLDLTVDAVKANGDVRITGLANLFSSAETNKAAIITKGNLFLNVGESGITDEGFSIGASGKFFAVQAAGNTQLLATGDIYLQSIGDLNVLDIVAGRSGNDNGGIINLRSVLLDGNANTGNIYGVYVPTQDVQGNIRSDNNKSITLNAAGSIGSWTDSKKTIRFKNVAVDAGADAILSLTAGKEIVVEGVSTADPLAEKLDGKYQVPAQGKLVIAELDSTTAKKARITVNGAVEFKDDSVDFGRNNGSELDIYGAGKLKVTGSVKADTLVLSGAAGVQLTGTAIGTNVTLQAGVKPELTANVLSVAITDNADVTTSDLAATPAYVGGIQAVNLAVKANRDIDLGGTDKIKVDNADLDTTRNVKFNNYSVSGFVDGNTKSSVKVYNSADTVEESCVTGTVDITFGEGNTTFATASQTLVTKGIDAVGKIKILSSGGLENAENADIYSEKNNIIVRAEKDLINNGRIFVENKENTDGIYGYVATGSNFVNNNIIGGDAACIILGAMKSLTNSGDVYSNKQSVCLMALGEIANKGNYTQIQEFGSIFDFYSDDYQFISAGKNVVLCAGEGLRNEAVIAGGLTYAGHRTATGGNVFLDDFENFADNIGTDLQSAMAAAFAETGYTGSGDEFKSKGDIHNLGLVVAYKNETAGSGLVHFDSSKGKTENEGAIYSVDGKVFMDSTEDLINHKDIIVINTGISGTVDCNVTLQATGNIYNTGDITVRGKGAVLIDADAMDQASMTADGKTIEGLVSDGESALNSYKKISTINLTDDAGNPAGTLTYLGIYNTGNIFTNEGDVTFKSFAGSIYNTDELADVTSSAALTKSNGKILMEAPRGSVENTKALYATKNIEITSKSHIYNLPALNENAPTEYAGQSIMRGLTSENGDIKLTSNEGAIVNDGIIETKNGDIFLTANGYVEYKRLKDEDGNGRINFDDLKYGVTDADSKTYEELATEYFATDKGKIKAGIYNHTDSDYIANGGNIEITSVYTIDASGFFTATNKAPDGSTKANKGNITVTTSSTTDGDIYHYAHTNTQVKEGSGIFISETYGPGENAYEMVRADGAIKYSAARKAYLITDMIAEDSIKLTFDEGTTISKEIICLNGDVTIQTKGQSSDGNLLVNAKITSGGAVNLISAGNLKFGDDEGTNNALIEAKDDITLTAERDIKVIDATKFETQEGGLELTSNKGGIDVTGDIEAKDFVRLYTKGDNDETRAGDYTERFEEGAYTAPSNISAGALSGIKVAGDITTNGDLDIATYGDDVSVKNLTAEKMAAVGTSGGKINIEGTIKGNDVALYSEKETADINFGKIEVTEKLILAGNEFNLDMSNIQTDSDLFDLYVYGAIGADGTVNPTGSIKIDYRNIPGGEKKDVRIRQMNAVNAEIHTAGALTIDNLSVANRAEIDVMGTKTDVFGTMQAADADAQFIYYDPGKGATALDLSHVYFGYDLASKQAHVEALSRDPSIFEKPAYNPDTCPVCAEEALLTAGGGTGTIPGSSIGGTSGNKGHKFEQSSSGTQRFAGVLLMNNFGYKSYAQRFSAEDLMTHLEDIKAIGQYDNYFNIGLNFFDRFNIIDIPDVAVNSITLNNTFRDSGIIVVRDDKKEDEYDF